MPTESRKSKWTSSVLSPPSLCVLVPLYARKFTTDASLTSSWDAVGFGGSPKVEVSLCAPYGPPWGPPESVSASSASCQCHTRKRTIPFPFSPSFPSVMSAVRTGGESIPPKMRNCERQFLHGNQLIQIHLQTHQK